MLQTQQGDEQAFNALVLRHQRSVLNLVRRFVGPVPDVEDLAQEVFVRLYQARASYRPTARFTTYLYRNTLNLCLNFIRDRKHRRTAPLDKKEEEGPRVELPDPAVENPSKIIADRERADIVRQSVSALPENQRTAVILSRWHGLSYQEIAETMDLSIMAVKSLLSRAKENLRTKLSVLLKDEESVSESREGNPA
ncbi:MAG: RNA polymerase sigma factor [Planctomycetota bacterium]|jgi:RNA polymerase sigma-70 factor (ECF subfamily)